MRIVEVTPANRKSLGLTRSYTRPKGQLRLEQGIIPAGMTAAESARTCRSVLITKAAAHVFCALVLCVAIRSTATAAGDEIRIVSNEISGEFPVVTIHALVTIGGAQHVIALPVTVEFREDGLVASGTTDIAHAELGLSPFKAALGMLRVAEDMTFRYRVVGRKVNDHAE